jgi:hypothetical protein
MASYRVILYSFSEGAERIHSRRANVRRGKDVVVNNHKGITNSAKLPIGGTRARGGRSLSILALVVATTMAFAAFASTSFAADPTSAQYCDGLTTTTSSDCSSVEGSSASGTSAQKPVSKAAGGLGNQVGSLPFTGWDLMTLAAIAVALTASGLVLARLTNGRRPSA